MNVADLATWPVGWNGYDALPATPEVCAAAQQWIDRFEQEVQAEWDEWLRPNCAPEGDGNGICFEWWHGQKKLLIFVDAQGVTDCLKVTGTDPRSPIDDGEAETPEQRQELWRWLRSDT